MCVCRFEVFASSCCCASPCHDSNCKLTDLDRVVRCINNLLAVAMQGANPDRFLNDCGTVIAGMKRRSEGQVLDSAPCGSSELPRLGSVTTTSSSS